MVFMRNFYSLSFFLDEKRNRANMQYMFEPARGQIKAKICAARLTEFYEFHAPLRFTKSLNSRSPLCLPAFLPGRALLLIAFYRTIK